MFKNSIAAGEPYSELGSEITISFEVKLEREKREIGQKIIQLFINVAEDFKGMWSCKEITDPEILAFRLGSRSMSSRRESNWRGQSLWSSQTRPCLSGRLNVPRESETSHESAGLA